MRLSFITSVWLLSIFMLPLIWICWDLITDAYWKVDMAWLILIGGFLFSLPVYALCVMARVVILPSRTTLARQIIFWLGGSVFFIVCMFLILVTMTGGGSYSHEGLQFILAPIIATLFSTGLLFKQLIRLNVHLNKQPHDTLDTTAVE